MSSPNERRAAIIAAMPKHLRTMAGAVRGLATRQHRNPEAAAIAYDEVASNLTSLAAVIEQAEQD